jgi:CheY-like chemotaxis protein
LRDFLKKRGHDVLVASDGVGAIKQILDHDIHLVVTDYRMDILGGDYWIRFLRTFCRDKKVIITSGFLQPEFPIPFPVVYKPYDYSDLEALIRKTLSEGPSSAENARGGSG